MILSWSLVTTSKLPEGERPALLMPLLETACRLAESTPLGPAFSLLQNSVQNLSPAAAAALTQAMQVQCTTLAQSLHRGAPHPSRSHRLCHQRGDESQLVDRQRFFVAG